MLCIVGFEVVMRVFYVAADVAFEEHIGQHVACVECGVELLAVAHRDGYRLLLEWNAAMVGHDDWNLHFLEGTQDVCGVVVDECLGG